ARVPVRVHDVEFASVLGAVFVGSHPPPRCRLGLSVHDRVITISTEEDLERDARTRVYDVRELLPPTATATPAARAAAVDQLVARLTRSVAPGKWREYGGSVGSIRELQGQLIVTQTEANQAQ